MENMKLEEFLQLTERKGLDNKEQAERMGHLERIYNHAKEMGISDQLTPELSNLIAEAYDIKRDDEIITHFEHYH